MNENAVFAMIHAQAQRISQHKAKPVRIAINGIEGTGKTVFATALTTFINQSGNHAMQVSIDGFHFNKAHRYKQGRNSAKGYYEDSYDEQGFVDKVLIRSQETPASIYMASHDLETDEYLDQTPMSIPDDIILITDGAYLFKPIYRPHWDIKIYLKTDFGTALQRGAERDAPSLGGFEVAAEKFRERYHKASAIYIENNEPETLADLIVDNTDFNELVVLQNRFEMQDK